MKWVSVRLQAAKTVGTNTSLTLTLFFTSSRLDTQSHIAYFSDHGRPFQSDRGR